MGRENGFLVYSVGDGVAGVQLDSMEFGITDGWGRGHDGGMGVDKSSIRSMSNWGGMGVDKAGSSGITVVVVKTSMSKWNSSIRISCSSIRMGNYGGGSRNNKGFGGSGSFSGSLFTVGFGFESSLESFFGSFDFGGVFEGCRVKNGGDQRFGVEGRGNQRLGVEDGSFAFENGSYGKFDFGNSGSNWEVGSLDTESQMIGDIVGGLDNAIGINIRIRSLNSSISVSYFLFDRVEVRITILNIAEFILSLELR